MELGSILALCIATLIIALVQLLVIAGLAGHALTQPRQRQEDEERPASPSLRTRSTPYQPPALPKTNPLQERTYISLSRAHDFPRTPNRARRPYSPPPRPVNPHLRDDDSDDSLSVVSHRQDLPQRRESSVSELSNPRPAAPTTNQPANREPRGRRVRYPDSSGEGWSHFLPYDSGAPLERHDAADTLREQQRSRAVERRAVEEDKKDLPNGI
jgi:hypothetical protein